MALFNFKTHNLVLTLWILLALLCFLSGDVSKSLAQAQNQNCQELQASWLKTMAGKSLVPKQWGEHLQGIDSRLPQNIQALDPQNMHNPELQNSPAAPVIALTLDACSGLRSGNYDATILDLLEQHKIAATFFVTPSWVRRNLEVFQRIASNPLFEIASHGLKHRPCSLNGRSVYGIEGTASLSELCSELSAATDQIIELGALPNTLPVTQKIRWFRAGTAFYDELAVSFIRHAGYRIAGYTVSLDEGATLSAKKVAQRVLALKGGEIVLAHFSKPQSGTGAGLAASLPLLVERGVMFVRLSSAFGVEDL